jgi:hypothetical protein
MFEQRELRSSREGRKKNGVKNLKGAKPFPKTYSYHGFGKASFLYYFFAYFMTSGIMGA